MKSIRLLVSNRNSRYDISINSKVIQIVGNSGTGKTSLADAFSSLIEQKLTDHVIMGVKGYSVTSKIATGSNPLTDSFRLFKKSIIIIDACFYADMQDPEVWKAIQENESCYFIILGRGSYAGVDEDNIYRFKTVDGVNMLEKVEESRVD